MWLEFNIKIHCMAGKNVNFQPKKLEKDQFLMKFGWNFKFYTSGHPVILFQN